MTTTGGQCCDLCGSRDARELYTGGRGGEQVSNVICQQCGLVYVEGDRDPGALERFYTGGGFTEQARGAGPPSPEKITLSETRALERYRVLRPFIVPGDGLRAVEVGCGLGSFVRLLQGAGLDAMGIEPDPAYADYGRDLYQVRIEDRLYEDTLITGQSVGLFCAFHVLEHVSSPSAFARKMSDELGTGSLAFVEVPCVERPYGGNLDRFFWSAHLTTFSRNTLGGLLALHGLGVLHAGYDGDFLQIIARKAGEPPTGPRFPLDDPQSVAKTLLAAHRVFLDRKQEPERAVSRIVRVAGEAALHPGQGARKIARRLPRAPWIRKPRAVFHFGLHTPANAGDTLLFESVRKLLDFRKPHAWTLRPLWEEVTRERVREINASASAVVIGGGGLFLRDTNANTVSGWQWPCPARLLREIKPPLIMYSVGYNRFRGQEDFDPVFREYLGELADRAAFFGLRNRGSMRRVAGYLDPGLASKLDYQPCPTTVLSRLHPLSCYDEKRTRPVLALNLAFDRHALRFGGREDAVLGAVARVVRRAGETWSVRLAVHGRLDATVIPWLDRAGAAYEEVNLECAPPEEVMRFYACADLAVGMRGHAQMVPFGTGAAIVSLVSHDKLGWFLDDIGHPEWGVEIPDPALEDKLSVLVDLAAARLDTVKRLVEEAKESLWNTCMKNLDTLEPLLGCTGLTRG